MDKPSVRVCVSLGYAAPLLSRLLRPPRPVSSSLNRAAEIWALFSRLFLGLHLRQIYSSPPGPAAFPEPSSLSLGASPRHTQTQRGKTNKLREQKMKSGQTRGASNIQRQKKITNTVKEIFWAIVKGTLMSGQSLYTHYLFLGRRLCVCFSPPWRSKNVPRQTRTLEGESRRRAARRAAVSITLALGSHSLGTGSVLETSLDCQCVRESCCALCSHHTSNCRIFLLRQTKQLRNAAVMSVLFRHTESVWVWSTGEINSWSQKCVFKCVLVFNIS